MELTLHRGTEGLRAGMSRESARSSLGSPRSAGWPRQGSADATLFFFLKQVN